MAEICKSLFFSYCTPSLKTIILTGALIFLVYYLWTWLQDWNIRQVRQKIDHQCHNLPQNETIFISIITCASEAHQCAQTMFDIFEKAYCPFRIFIGILQYGNFDLLSHNPDTLLEKYKNLSIQGKNDFSHQLRIMSRDFSEYKGYFEARHTIETQLFKDEQFYLLAGDRFMMVHEWDKKIINEWTMCQKRSPKPILTGMPSFFKPHQRSITPINFNHQMGQYLRFKNFDSIPDFTLSNGGTDINLIQIESIEFMRKPTWPVPGVFWSSIFSFSHSEMIREVPFDPEINGIYEIYGDFLVAVRLWTNGYDFFHPTLTYIGSIENSRQSFADFPTDIMTKDALNRIKTLLEYQQQSTILPPYGLGSIRTYAQYQQLIGINVMNKTFISMAGILGMETGSSANAVLCRFGSWKNFEKIKTGLIRLLT